MYIQYQQTHSHIHKNTNNCAPDRCYICYIVYCLFCDLRFVRENDRVTIIARLCIFVLVCPRGRCCASREMRFSVTVLLLPLPLLPPLLLLYIAIYICINIRSVFICFVAQGLSCKQTTTTTQPTHSTKAFYCSVHVLHKR